MKRVFLHLKPKTDIPIYFSGFNPKDAFVTGKNSGRLFTEGRLEFFRDAILPKFEEGVKASGRDPRTTERVVAVDLATGPTDKILKKLRRVVAGGYAKGRFNRRDPRVIEAAEKMLSDQEILDHIYRYNTSAQVIETVEKFRKAGATQVSICEIGEDPEKAMRVYSAGDPAL